MAMARSQSCIPPYSYRIYKSSCHANINIASYLHGAAHMSAHTNASIWTTIVTALLDTANTTFFSPFPNATGINVRAHLRKASSVLHGPEQFQGLPGELDG
ncbi:hypothetical protein LTR54_012601 [Friedmanniomyces endolithicus]|nr:hypothetical protein LTR54_012601 [Friedmanniomyces endolithicus]